MTIQEKFANKLNIPKESFTINNNLQQLKQQITSATTIKQLKEVLLAIIENQ